MDEQITAYLAAVDNGDRSAANKMLDQMFAEMDANNGQFKRLDEAATALNGLFKAADEIMASDLYQ